MKKRHLFLTVLVVALVALFAISASAEVTTYDDFDVNALENIEYRADDIVVFDDGFSCPSVYVFKDIEKIGEGPWGAPDGLKNALDFTYINSKVAPDKEYGFDDIDSLDIPQGITSMGRYACHTLKTIRVISIPDSVVSLGSAIFQNASGLEYCIMEHSEDSELTTLSGSLFSASGLKAFSMPDCITTLPSGFEFQNCKSLTAVYLSKNLTSITATNACFDYCDNLYLVNESFVATSEGQIPVKPSVYYFPSSLTTFESSNAFRGCKSVNDVLVFGSKFTTIKSRVAFQGSPANTIVFLGDMEDVVAYETYYWGTKNLIFANPNDKSEDDLNLLLHSSQNAYFCHGDNVSHLVEKDLGTKATCITNQFVKSYCFCGTLVEDKEIPNTATGIHTFVTNDCTVSVRCTGDEKCDAMSDAKEKHALVHTLSYANGFDKAGVYNYYCENAGCTIADKAVHDAEKSPIITFKGYSTPETGNVKGINAGFKVEKDLLTLYNDLNEVDATLTIFMVNSKSNDVNISKILDGDTLELADGVKGINVKITSVNYTSISVEVRGFDDSEGGSFYTLNLITAIAVKTADGVHYVQAGLKNSPNTTQTVDGVDFNIVTANKVYNPAS